MLLSWTDLATCFLSIRDIFRFIIIVDKKRHYINVNSIVNYEELLSYSIFSFFLSNLKTSRRSIILLHVYIVNCVFDSPNT